MSNYYRRAHASSGSYRQPQEQPQYSRSGPISIQTAILTNNILVNIINVDVITIMMVQGDAIMTIAHIVQTMQVRDSTMLLTTAKAAHM